jgi:hypothetical protein
VIQPDRTAEISQQKCWQNFDDELAGKINKLLKKYKGKIVKNGPPVLYQLVGQAEKLIQSKDYVELLQVCNIMLSPLTPYWRVTGIFLSLNKAI